MSGFRRSVTVNRDDCVLPFLFPFPTCTDFYETFFSHVPFFVQAWEKTTAPFLPTNVPAQLTLTGRVSGIDTNLDILSMTVLQEVQQAAPHTCLVIQARLENNFLGHFPLRHLPHVNHFISCTGSVESILHGIATITVDDLSYLPSCRRRAHRYRPNLFSLNA